MIYHRQGSQYPPYVHKPADPDISRQRDRLITRVAWATAFWLWVFNEFILWFEPWRIMKETVYIEDRVLAGFDCVLILALFVAEICCGGGKPSNASHLRN